MAHPKNFHHRLFISSLGVRMCLLLVLSLVLMSLDHRLRSFDKVRQVLFVGTSPVHYLINHPIQTVQYLLESFALQKHLNTENRALKQKQLLLSEKLQKLSVLEAENVKLRALLQSSARLKGKVLTAQLLSVDLSPFTQQVLLNKGQSQGVYVGQPVIDEAGVMGQVIEAGPFTSRVLLTTDKLSSIPVQVNRNGLRTIAAGTGSPELLSLLYLPETSDIQVGDLLVTSGLGNVFPFGYPVGVVSLIKRKPGEYFIQVFAKPSAGINRSRQVLLLWPDTDRASALVPRGNL